MFLVFESWCKYCWSIIKVFFGVFGIFVFCNFVLNLFEDYKVGFRIWGRYRLWLKVFEEEFFLVNSIDFFYLYFYLGFVDFLWLV